MLLRLKTSKASKERLEYLNRVLRMSNNAIILRYAISISIVNEINITKDPSIKIKDNNGFEISEATLYGESESAYKIAMNITVDNEDQFFPTLTNLHIERGLIIMEREYKIAGNKDKFVRNVIRKYIK